MSLGVEFPTKGGMERPVRWPQGQCAIREGRGMPRANAGAYSAAGSRSSIDHPGADAINRVPTIKWLNVPTAGRTRRLEVAHPWAIRVDVNRPPRPEALFGGGVEAGHTFACGFGVPGYC